MDKTAVLIPCYNEETTIKKVIEDFKKYLPEAVIYVYDNASADNTKETAEKAGAIVRTECQKGKGSVIRRMFREIDAECYVMCDGDDTYNLSGIRKMTDAVLTDKCDMVTGDRLTGGYRQNNTRAFHEFGNDLMRKMIKRLFKADIPDVMSGCRAFSYNFVKTFPVISRGFSIETEMTIHALDKRMKTASVTIGYKERKEGSESKVDTVRDGIKIIMTALRLFYQYRPLMCMSLISLTLAAVSGILVFPVFAEYLATGLVPRFPTLIACGFMFLTAVMIFLIGLLLQNRSLHDRQEFERSLLLTDQIRKEKIKEEERKEIL